MPFSDAYFRYLLENLSVGSTHDIQETASLQPPARWRPRSGDRPAWSALARRVRTIAEVGAQTPCCPCQTRNSEAVRRRPVGDARRLEDRGAADHQATTQVGRAYR